MMNSDYKWLSIQWFNEHYVCCMEWTSNCYSKHDWNQTHQQSQQFIKSSLNLCSVAQKCNKGVPSYGIIIIAKCSNASQMVVKWAMFTTISKLVIVIDHKLHVFFQQLFTQIRYSWTHKTNLALNYNSVQYTIFYDCFKNITCS